MGPFILDTGASLSVITGRAAETLGPRAFGEGSSAASPGRPRLFRRGGPHGRTRLSSTPPCSWRWTWGYRLRRVRTRRGHHRLRRVQIIRVGGWTPRAPVRLYDPATFAAPAAWRWRSLLMVSNVPHVAADFAGAPNGEARVFMIDSGAGVPTASSTRAPSKNSACDGYSHPPDGGGARSSSRVRGVGGSGGESSGATRAYRGKLEWLRLRETGESGNGSGTGEETSTESSTSTSTSSSTSTSTSSSTSTSTSSSTPKLDGGGFENLSVLLAADAGFDLSEHSCGLICANALNSRRVVYDARNRAPRLLVDGVDPETCEGVLCESVEWEEEKATRRAERRKKREAFFPSPEEWRGSSIASSSETTSDEETTRRAEEEETSRWKKRKTSETRTLARRAREARRGP